jgi:hypothetical protein
VQVEIRFNWWRERDPSDYVVKGDHRRRPSFTDILHDGLPSIAAKGVRLEPYQPLKEFPDLFAQFAAIQSADDAIKFVKNFGPLTERGLPTERGSQGKGDTFTIIVGQSQAMASGTLHVGSVLCSLNTGLVAGHDGIHLIAEPNNLLDALWLQYAEARAAGLANRCKQCKRLFATGPDAGRRRGAEFCSIECKTKYHSLQRSR